MSTMRSLLLSALLGTSSTAAFLFEDFVTEFGKEYGSLEEKAKAARTFAANQQRVADLGAENPRATFSIRTRWADMTRDEFTAMHGHKAGETPCQFPDPSMSDIVKLSPTAKPLDSLDYVALGATVAVKDQGSCSSCWAHATTAVVEGRLKLDTGNITSLSEQYLMDCDKSRLCKGCCGGLTEDSMQWLAGYSEGGTPGAGPGIASEEAYPYTSYDGTDPTQCEFVVVAAPAASVAACNERPLASFGLFSITSIYRSITPPPTPRPMLNFPPPQTGATRVCRASLR